MKTLKTLLLGGIVSCMTILGFASAGSITITSNGSTTSSYTPSSYKLPEGVSTSDITISNAVCNGYGNDTYLIITNGKTDEYEMESCDIVCDGYNNLQNGCADTDILEGETIYFKSYYDLWGDDEMLPITSITLNIPEGESGGSGTGGGSDSGSSDLTSQLTPIITGLTTSINEFIPYVVYVSLGILGVVIGFFAIKRLMRYVKGSTLSVFSSRKKRK